MADIKNVRKVIESRLYGEQIAKMCKTPRTTSELRQMYVAERRKSSIGGISTFSEHLDALEEGKVIEYKDGKWQTTSEGVEALAKYFG